MRYRPQVESIDVCKVVRVACEEWKVVGQRDGGDHRVIGPSPRLSAGAVQRCSHPPKGSRRGGVEGKGVEVGLRLLEPELSCRLLTRRRGHEGSDRQLGEGDGGDEWLRGKRHRVVNSFEQHTVLVSRTPRDGGAGCS